jgi:hypothetical protein
MYGEQNTNGIVNLNIGGKKFSTSLDTLTRDQNSMLAAMFSRKFQSGKKDYKGEFYFDLKTVSQIRRILLHRQRSDPLSLYIKFLAR